MFPCDPRPVAFAVDQRFRDGEIAAVVTATGAGAGVVLRRVGPRVYYAAVYDDEARALVVLRRSPAGEHELARAPVPRLGGPAAAVLRAQRERLDRARRRRCAGTRRRRSSATARDAAPRAPARRRSRACWRPRARSSRPQGPPVLPGARQPAPAALGVQEGAAVPGVAGRAGAASDASRERSTAAFARDRGPRGRSGRGATAPSVVGADDRCAARRRCDAAGGGRRPRARRRSRSRADPRFRRGRGACAPGRTNAFDAVIASASAGSRPGSASTGARACAARGRRDGRPDPQLPRAARAPAAAPARDRDRAPAPRSSARPSTRSPRARPDVFVWQGDLNYPDTMGPLAQTVAGLRRHLARLPRQPADRADLRATRCSPPSATTTTTASRTRTPPTSCPWGLAPWEALMERRAVLPLHGRAGRGLGARPAPLKSDPSAAGHAGQDAARRGAARLAAARRCAASKAPFKVICSPCTLAPLPRQRARRQLGRRLHRRARPPARPHPRSASAAGRSSSPATRTGRWSTTATALFEARPCPLGIPTPNDITLTQPQAAEDARAVPGRRLRRRRQGPRRVPRGERTPDGAPLDLALVREDGETPFPRRFEEPLPRR